MRKPLPANAGSGRSGVAALGAMVAGLYLFGLVTWLTGWQPLTAHAAVPALNGSAPARTAEVPRPSVKPSAPASHGKRTLPGEQDRADAPALRPAATPVNDVGGWVEKLAGLNYDLRQVRLGTRGVPREFLDRLPRELPSIRSAEVRKAAFIKSILPLVLRTNRAILAERGRLLEMAARFRAGAPVDINDQAWLFGLARSYGLAEVDIDELERRVDIVPPSLALAQAAEESGWGTSRFAIEGNAVYGQWTWRKGGGLVPRRRDRDKRHEVRIFESLRTSVDAYARNLNTHWAYDGFRRTRAILRAARRPLSGDVLAGAMIGYSERGAAYVETIRTVIRHNRLSDLDGARLHDSVQARTEL